MGSDRDTVVAAYAALGAALDVVAGLDYDSLTHPELLGLLGQLEVARRRQPAVEHRLITRLVDEAAPAVLGAKNMVEVLRIRLRVSDREARRRLAEAADLGPRTALSGEGLAPRLPATSAAQSRGAIGAEHIGVIRQFFKDLPHAVDDQTREQAEHTLAQIAVGQGPEELKKAADHLAALLDPDGDLPDDTDQARRRHLTLHPQARDGMSSLTALLDPEGRATMEAVLATLAAPGKANPDDQAPCVDGEPSPDHIDADTRTQLQRNHDALTALGRAMLASSDLGQRNGLPATIIVTTTLAELESATGHAVTAGGSLLPMRDVIRLASHAHHYLLVYDTHTEVPLYLGRARRLASPGQRIVLHARDRGCTHPGCTVPGYGCQVHHAVLDWSAGGQTNIDDLTFACGPHNRLVDTGGWRTRKRRDGRTEWLPPPHLDTGQPRTNPHHHPERLLNPEPDDEVA